MPTGICNDFFFVLFWWKINHFFPLKILNSNREKKICFFLIFFAAIKQTGNVHLTNTHTHRHTPRKDEKFIRKSSLSALILFVFLFYVNGIGNGSIYKFYDFFLSFFHLFIHYFNIYGDTVSETLTSVKNKAGNQKKKLNEFRFYFVSIFCFCFRWNPIKYWWQSAILICALSVCVCEWTRQFHEFIIVIAKKKLQITIKKIDSKWINNNNNNKKKSRQTDMCVCVYTVSAHI